MDAASTAGQQAVFANTLQERRRQRNKRFLLWLGITEIVIGLTSCALGVVTLGAGRTYENSRFFHIGQGIWCGFILIISGILGAVAHIHPTKVIYRANLALSALGVVVMVVLLITSVMAIGSMSHYTGYFIALGVEAFVGIFITSIHFGYSNVERPVNTRTPRYNQVRYGQVPLQQFTAFQMPNGQIMYYPSQAIPSASMYPSHVPGAMVPAPMLPNVMHPIHSAQSAFPASPATMVPVPAATSNVSQPAHSTQSVQYPTTAQNGQPIVYPPYSGPMVYHHPTTVPASYVMPTQTLPVVIPEPNQQMPANSEVQQSSISQEVTNSDNDPPMYDDATGPLIKD